MLAPREPRQHLPRIVVVARLPENLPVDDHRGIGRENHVVRAVSNGRRGLLARQSEHIVVRRLVDERPFVDVDRTNDELEAGGGKEVGAPGRR